MKGMTKKITLGLFAVVVACCLFAFAGCASTSTYQGQYDYESNGNHYGIVVEVTVNDNDDTIKSVKVLDSDYMAVTDNYFIDGVWDETNVQKWNDGLNDLLASYKGLSVSYVLGLTVETVESGEPTSVSDSSLIISGCTQGSGRLLLAVQNALKNA